MLTEEQAEEVRQRFLEQIEKLPEEQPEQKEQKENLKRQIMAATPQQLEMAIKEGTGEECIFCGIARGEVETVKVYEDSHVIAFLDINPSCVGQTIIIPKAHHQFIFQIPDQILWSITKAIKILEPLIVNTTAAKGMSIYISQGNAAGQYFKHLSVNMIPRFEDDKAAFYWERKKVSKEELEKIAAKIKSDAEKMLVEERQRVEKKLREERGEKAEEKKEKPVEMPRRRM